MALPAIGDLRRHFPRARLIVAARRAIAGLFTMSPIVDEVIVMEWSRTGVAPASRRADIAALRRAPRGRQRPAAEFVCLGVAGSSRGHSRALGICDRHAAAAAFARVPRPAIRVHQAEYYRRLVKGLGIENGPLDPDARRPTPRDRARHVRCCARRDGTRIARLS